MPRGATVPLDRLWRLTGPWYVDRLQEDWRPKTPDVIERLFIYDHFVKTTRAPSTAEIAAGVKAKGEAVEKALKKLADQHAIVLAPASLSIWMAHPFSAVPTPYPVDTGGRTYWANCAWDAAGILSLVGDGETRTLCADCGQPAGFGVQDGAIVGDGIVHFAVPPRRFWENVAYT